MPASARFKIVLLAFAAFSVSAYYFFVVPPSGTPLIDLHAGERAELQRRAAEARTASEAAYIQRRARWVETVSGHGRIAEIPVFALEGHARALRAFAWRGLGWRDPTIYVVPQLPPVSSAAEAFRIVIRAAGRHHRELSAEATKKRRAN